MSELIDFKTKKLIKKFKPIKSIKEVKKQKSISFLRELIKNLKEEKLDPESCIVFLKWNISSEREEYQYFTNEMTNDTTISLIELCKLKYLQDII